MRAMRPDKLTLAALVATLEVYRDGHAESTLPVWRMIAATPTALAKRARAIATQLATNGVDSDVVETQSTVGGGSLPEETQPSRAVAIGARHGRANEIAARLRAGEPPIIARVVHDRAALDMRSVAPEDDEMLARAVSAALTKER
jgi:L-seryl-tRNA(Ser) seleniumtransferase